MKTIVVSFAFLILTSGCATVHRPSTTIDKLQAEGQAAIMEQRQTKIAIIDKLVDRIASSSGNNVDILILSGGGQNGAYGAGFLKGWKERKTSAMPEFDIVTGISAGALISPFALLGNKESLDEISHLFNEAAVDFAPKFDWLFWLNQNGGIVKDDLYDAEIAKVYNQDIQTKLHVEFLKNRQLLIGTADLDLGIGRIWNMEKEFGTKSENLPRAHQVFQAATAIPGVFPAEFMDKHLHVDGGIVSNIMPVLDLKDYKELASKLKIRGITRPLKIHLYVIMNIWIYSRLMAIDPASRKDISNRGNTITFFLSQAKELIRIHELTQAVSTGIPGFQMDMKLTAIPTEKTYGAGSKAFFDAGWVKELSQLGYDRAMGDHPWDEVPSIFERP